MLILRFCLFSFFVTLIHWHSDTFNSQRIDNVNFSIVFKALNMMITLWFFSWIPHLILLLGSSTNFEWVVEVISSSASSVDHPRINVLLMSLIGVLDLYVIRIADWPFVIDLRWFNVCYRLQECCPDIITFPTFW
jgi:hypothetical protein